MTPLFKGYFAGVGSRNTPPDVLNLMEQLSYHLYGRGYALSSGDALGADRAFYAGAIKSSHFGTVKARIYLAWNGIGDRYANDAQGFLDATCYPTWEEASKLALEARGSFEGLGRGGIALHTRNVYQIRGHTLDQVVKALIYWGIPMGKTEKVKGGTNTALQLSIKASVPIRINLYTDEGMSRAIKFLQQCETINSGTC